MRHPVVEETAVNMCKGRVALVTGAATT